MVGFDECRKMGEHAVSGQSSNYKNTIKGSMKRLVGLCYDDPRAQAEMKWLPGVTFQPFPHASGGPPSVGVEIYAGSDKAQLVPVEAIAGMMIYHMGEIAAQKAAEASDVSDVKAVFPQDWVVSIPHYFTDAQRRALLAGCEIVGITGVQRLMHDNTATALSYGIFKDLKKEFTKDCPTHVMFIDMGASAYSVSVATFEPGQLIVKSCFCDPDLGGRDFDMAIAQWVNEKFRAKYGSKLSGNPLLNPKAMLKLMGAAEKAKKTLSPFGVNEAVINIEMLFDELDFHVTLTSEEYEKLCEPLLARLAGPIQKALAEAKLTSASELAAVEIVGGSTRIGCVKRRLLNILQVSSLSTTMNADEAVCRGAALMSAILSPRFKVLPYDIHEANPYPVSITWPPSTDDETSSVVMFDRNLNFPIVRRVTLKRAGTMRVSAVYDASASNYGFYGSSNDIATFEIHNASTDPVKVRVNVKQDISGIINLSSAQMVEEVGDDEEGEKESDGKLDTDEKKKKIRKTNLEFTVTRPLNWTTAEINRYNEVEVSMANHDRIIRETANMRNELESYIYDMRDKISGDSQLGSYCSEAEKSAFLAKTEAMETWLYDEGFDETKKVYSDKLSELKALGTPIEKRQMEHQERPAAVSSLQAALENFSNWVNESQGDEEKYGHVTDEEREQVRSKTDEIRSWTYDMLDKQGSLGLHVDPVLTIHQVKMKHKELVDKCSPIMNKPKPAPKKENTKPDPPVTKAQTNPDITTDMDGVEIEADSEKMQTE